MALRDWLQPSATAIPAIPAIHAIPEPRIARIARIAVAGPANPRGAEPSLEAQAELRRLLTEIAAFAPSYWKPSDIEEAVTVAVTDLDNALQTFRALAEQYRRH